MKGNKLSCSLVILLLVGLLMPEYVVAQQDSASIDGERYATEDIIIDAPWRVVKEDGGYDIPIIVALYFDNAVYNYKWNYVNIYYVPDDNNDDNNELMCDMDNIEGLDIIESYDKLIFQLNCSELDNPDLCSSYFNDNTTLTLKVEFRADRKLGPVTVGHKDATKYLKVYLATNQLPIFPNWYYGDPHYHSTFTNQRDDFAEKESGGDFAMMALSARKIGLDWVTVTDHTEVPILDIGWLNEETWGEFEDSCSDYTSDNFIVIPSEEIYSKLVDYGDLVVPGNHHLLGLHLDNFVPPLVETEDQSMLPTLLNTINAAGGMAFAAHPYNSTVILGQTISGGWDYDRLVNALENDVFIGLELWNTCKTSRTSLDDIFDINDLQNIDPFPWGEEMLSGWDSELETGIAEWDEMLNKGLRGELRRRIFICGGSDAHGDFNYEVSAILGGIGEHATNNAFGKVRTAVFSENGLDASGENIMAGLADGHMVATNGPLVIFGLDLNNDGVMDKMVGDDVAFDRGGQGKFIIRAGNTPEFGGSLDINIFRNGEIIESAEMTLDVGENPAEDVFTIDLSADNILPESDGWCYYRIEAVSTSASPISDLYRCYSNPLWLNVRTPSVMNAAIERGLDWLAAKQTKTSGEQAFIGSWGGSIDEDFNSFDGLTDYVDADGSWKFGSSPNAGITALALQAFLNRGYGIDHPVYGVNVQKAIDYLLRVQTQSGYHYGAIYNNRQGYETGMAIVALKSALDLGLPDDLHAQVQTAIDRAVNYYTQDVNVGWSTVSWRYDRSYTTPLSGDMSVNQWVYLALDATNYTDKDIWQKIYGYINAKSYKWDDRARIGYQNYSTWPRGNSLAGLWGLALAGERDVDAAQDLGRRMSNYISDDCPMNALISPINLHSSCVYSGAGYYYYIYELAKALTLQGTVTYCEENWYPIFAQRIVDQHQEDAYGYYWKTGWTDPSGYTIPTSGLGDYGNTALALLSLEVGVVPEDSRFVIRLRPDPSPGFDNDNIEGLYLNIYDRPLGEEGGHFAGPSDEGDWFTTIPNSQWNQTQGAQELEVSLSSAGSYTIEIHNDGDSDIDYDLDLVVYLPEADMPALPTEAVDSITFSGTVPANRIMGTSSTVTSIGGLSLHADPPVLYPNMVVFPNALDFTPIVNDSVYTFQFTISETDGFTELQNINIYATDMTDGLGHSLPSTCFNFSPAYIGVVNAGGSVDVSGTLIIPDSLTLALDEFEDLTGAIVVEGLRQNRLIGTSGSFVRFSAISIAVMENGRGVEGVPVDIYDAENTLISAMCTNFDGCCFEDSIRLGIYSASIVPPLGYLCQQTDVPLLLSSGLPDTVEFNLTRMNIVPDQRGSSFWRHTVSTAIFSDGGAGDLDEAVPLARYFDLIYQHFQKNRKNPVEIFNEPVPASGPGKLLVLSSLLGGTLPQVDSSIFEDVGISHQGLAKPTMEDDGNRTWDISDYDLSIRELTALLLNVVSGRLATFYTISEDGITVGQLITYADNLIYNDNEDDDITAYELLYRANYGITINSGIIPSATPNIAYMTDTPESDALPTEFSLGVNYPNPFNPVTEIGFGLPAACHVTLKVYNVLGQLVETLIDEPLEAGMHKVTWNASDAASGIYLYRIQAGAYTKARKMVLLK